MLAFSIGIILALLGSFSLFVMNILGILLRLDEISNTPIRYFCSIVLAIIHVILTIIGVWFLLDIVTYYLNIDVKALNTLLVAMGIFIGFIPAIFILNKYVSKFRNYMAQKRNNE